MTLLSIACNCHGKTAECYYDENVASKKLSLNIHGENIGGGVCVNCSANTAGINCETCTDGYYRPQWVQYLLFFKECILFKI